MHNPRSSQQSEVRQLATRLYREHRTYLFAIARRNATCRADAEEALQEAFIAFIRRFDPDRGAPPLAWLILTLKRECWRRRRDAHLDRYVGQEAERGGEELGAVLELLPSPLSGPEELAMEREEARHRFGRLRPDQRTALLLRAAGYSYREIGQHRGWTYTKVNRALATARATLRELAVA